MPSSKQITEDDLSLIILNMGRQMLDQLSHVADKFENDLKEAVGHDVPIDRKKLESRILQTKNEILESEICGRLLCEWIGHGEAVEQLRSANSVLKQD